MGFGISNELANIPSDTPLLFWIDSKVNNKENNDQKKKIIEENINIKIFSFETALQAINHLKKIKFNKIFIIFSGFEYIQFIKKFKNEINDYMICPKIIIFTSDKTNF